MQVADHPHHVLRPVQLLGFQHLDPPGARFDQAREVRHAEFFGEPFFFEHVGELAQRRGQVDDHRAFFGRVAFFVEDPQEGRWPARFAVARSP